MKKILFGVILFIGISFFSIPLVNASYEGNNIVKGEIEIRWMDYDNRIGSRPDSVTLNVSNGFDFIPITISTKNAKVEKVDDATTTWTLEVELPNKTLEDNYTYTSNLKVDHYRQAGYYGSIGEFSDKITIVYITDFTKTITYREHWNDGDARDVDRYSIVEMKEVTNTLERRRLNCGNDKDKYIDDNTCEIEIWLNQVYPFGDNGVPIWDSPYQFEYKVIDSLIGYDYDIKTDDDGNIDVYITYEPKKMDDSKVIVIWNDFNNKNKKRPETLKVSLYNKDEKEQSIILRKDKDWSSVITNLYLHPSYSFGLEDSEYSINVDNTEFYEFEVSGNNEEGYVIEANYIGEDLVNNVSNISVDIDNPNTSDNIIFYVVSLFVSSVSLVIIKKRLLSK